MNAGDMQLEKIDLGAMLMGKSEQLTADALLGGPIDITITALRMGKTDEQPLEIHYEGGAVPYKPCLSMRRVLGALWGLQAHTYIGRSLRLYRDEGVSYGGQRVAGVRISHASHIERDEDVPLAQGRGKKVPYKVRVLRPVPTTPSAPPPKAEAPPKRGGLPVDHLRKEGRASAERGTEALKAFWAFLDKEERAELKTELEKDWKPLAEKADEAAAAQEGEFAL